MSSIGFGTWAWGNKLLWGYDLGKDKVLEDSFNEAIKGGLDFIDTADSYGIGKLNGRSEKLLGDFFKKIPASKAKTIKVATKLAPYPWRLGRQGFKKAFQASQERLQGKLERVQLHWSTYRYAPWQEVQLIDGLGDLCEEGLISEIGVSNMGPKRLIWLHKRLKNRGLTLKSLQVQFSLLSPDTKSSLEIKNICKELNIELLAYSPLALGILTIPGEKYNYPKTLLRKRLYSQLLPKTKNLRKALNQIAKDRSVSQAQVALNWCKAHGAKPIVGIRTPSQAKEASNAAKWKLSKLEIMQLDEFKKECSARMPSNPFQSN